MLEFPAPRNEVVDYDQGDASGLSIRGEIDLATSPQLKLTLDKAIRESTGAFVLDLSDLELLDSSAVGLLLRARTNLADEARPLAIVCPPGPIRRMMELTHIDGLFSLYDSHEAAAAALNPSD